MQYGGIKLVGSGLPDFSELDRLRDVPEHAHRLARVMADYDHNLYIRKVPYGHPQFNPQKPYAVMYGSSSGGESYIIQNYPESMLDERIMADIISADVTKAGGSVDDIVALNAAHEFMKIKERQEEDAARRELARDLAKLGMTKNYAKHNGKLIFDPNA
jgi:hypothetical protein